MVGSWLVVDCGWLVVGGWWSVVGVREEEAESRAETRARKTHRQSVPHLPRKSDRHSCGDPATSGRTSDPLESSKYRACHANARAYRAAVTIGW